MKVGKCNESLEKRLWSNAGVTTQYMIPVTDAHKAYAKYIDNNMYRKLVIISNDFLRELKGLRLYQAAVLYDLMIHLTDSIVTTSKNMERAFPHSGYKVYGPRALDVFNKASSEAYDILFYTEFPPGQWLPTPVRKRETGVKDVKELRHHLWGTTMRRGYVKWGVPAEKMQDVAECREMVKYTINDVVKRLDSAKAALIKTDYPMAAIQYSDAYHMLEALTDIINSLRRNFGEEIAEIEMVFGNTANYECDQISDILG